MSSYSKPQRSYAPGTVMVSTGIGQSEEILCFIICGRREPDTGRLVVLYDNGSRNTRSADCLCVSDCAWMSDYFPAGVSHGS